MHHWIYIIFHVFWSGNLIFPPLLGAQAGRRHPSCHGRIRSDSCPAADPVCSWLWPARWTHQSGRQYSSGTGCPVAVFVHLMIGPCVAIPRTASTSFEMAVAPFLHNSDQTLFLIRCVYSFVFFTAAIVIALKPTHLKDLLGKIMTPVLLVLIAVTFFGVLVKLPALFAASQCLLCRAPHPQRIYHRLPDHGPFWPPTTSARLSP